jgi:hypothetical protein
MSREAAVVDPIGAGYPIAQTHFSDDEGNPAGGNTWGVGFAIGWQHGATRELGSDTPIRNGAFVEEVIEAAIGRLAFYQDSRFACAENAEAMDHLHQALFALRRRTRVRAERGVEGRNVV